MQIDIDFWELLMSIGALTGAFATMIWFFSTILFSQLDKKLDERFLFIKADLERREVEDKKNSEQLRQIEREFLMFQRDMPNQYVRREDYIRGQTIIESKLDTLHTERNTFVRREDHIRSETVVHAKLDALAGAIIGEFKNG
jgi:hypothetical protein